MLFNHCISFKYRKRDEQNGSRISERRDSHCHFCLAPIFFWFQLQTTHIINFFFLYFHLSLALGLSLFICLALASSIQFVVFTNPATLRDGLRHSLCIRVYCMCECRSLLRCRMRQARTTQAAHYTTILHMLMTVFFVVVAVAPSHSHTNADGHQK